MVKRSLFECIGIFIFALALALLTNFLRPDGLPLLRSHPSPLPPEDNQANIISLQALRERLEQPGTIIFDARSPEEFAEGHIPGATNLPYYEFSGQASRVLKDVPFDREIIAYCSGLDCSNAEDLAFLLKEKGYIKVKVFEEGWEEWLAKGMPIEKKESQ